MLAGAGVETVEQSMVQANLERVQKAFRGAGDNRAAAVMGREFGADVMLIGEALAKPNALKIAGSNLRSYMASVSLRAVRVDDSVNVASASETATAIAIDDVTGSSKCLKAAGEKIPDIYITCGTEDFLIEPNRAMHRFLESENVPHEYHEAPGIHDMKFWSEHIQYIVKWMFG